jgi:hypothetical protein
VGGVGAGAGDDRDPALHLGHHRPDHLGSLGGGEGHPFSGRPARHDAVGALEDLPLGELAKGRDVHLAVLERRDERNH